jgi:hypothetical protein
MHTKEITVTYLNKQLETYLTAKEFAQFKLNRLQSQHDYFPNPNIQKELKEYLEQVRHCAAMIDEVLQCIEWVKRIRVIKNEPSN